MRRGAALDLVQSMLSGHDGALSTVHASSPRLALVRLVTLSLMSEVHLPVYVARQQVASAIHVVVRISRFPDGTRRVTPVSEVRGTNAEEGYNVEDLFRFATTGREPDGKVVGQLHPSGFAQQVHDFGMAAGLRNARDLFPSDNVGYKYWLGQM